MLQDFSWHFKGGNKDILTPPRVSPSGAFNKPSQWKDASQHKH